MSGRTMNYKISLNTPAKPIMPSELPKVTIDYKGLLDFAKKKGVRVNELTESEKNRFVTPTE